jgi:hypothetical protein
MRVGKSKVANKITAIPHCLENRLTDGGKVVSLTHQQRSIPQKYHFSAKPQGLVRTEGLGKLKKFIHLIGCECECECSSEVICAVVLGEVLRACVLVKYFVRVL